jgi:hypothetical protein
MKAISLEQSMKAQRGFYSFFNFDAREGWVVSASRWPLYRRKRDHCTEDRVCLGAGLRVGDRENFESTGIRSPNFPAGKRSLNRLRYPESQ